MHSWCTSQPEARLIDLDAWMKFSRTLAATRPINATVAVVTAEEKNQQVWRLHCACSDIAHVWERAQPFTLF